LTPIDTKAAATIYQPQYRPFSLGISVSIRILQYLAFRYY
jgi:hypothetical protein